MRKKDWKDQFLDKLAWMIAALAGPFYKAYQDLQRARRRKRYYAGARSKRYDFKYKIKRFFNTYRALAYAGSAVIALVIVAVTVTAFVSGSEKKVAAVAAEKPATKIKQAEEAVASAPVKEEQLDTSSGYETANADNVGLSEGAQEEETDQKEISKDTETKEAGQETVAETEEPSQEDAESNEVQPQEAAQPESENKAEVALTTVTAPEKVSEDSETSLLEELKDNLNQVACVSVPGYEIVVNNESIAFLKTEEEAESLLEQLKARYQTNEETEYVRAYFQENVEIKEAYHPVGEWVSFIDDETILDYIIRGTKEQKRHIVEKGENFWVIAKGYGIPVDDLVKANPDVVPERLQIGQQISLVVPRPMISVYTVENAEYDDQIQYDVEYEDASSMYQGEYRTKVAGAFGERHVEAEIYRVNGLEVGRLITSEDIMADPVTKVVLRGTKDPPPRKGTGVFAKPTSRGYITSGFGWRWGRKHTGIDIGVSIGTPVMAADGGEVIFSGTKGGYGKCVIIDHGANMKTLYAHNSKLYVHKGDKVFKGQTIAASGNTGRSTGPHLHFEIRKNDVPVNPTGYVSY